MAPEVITDGKLYDTKADLWSLGVTVYEIANGNPPYANLEPLRAIAMIPRNAPAKLEGDWGLAMKEFMALCMTPDPSLRPSADELSRSKWIRAANKVPTTLLRELIAKYGEWVNAGGVRTSIIGDIARRDDTFTFDMDRPSSWLFDGGEDDFDESLVGVLGDEPYLGQQKRNNRSRIQHHQDDATATTRRVPAPQVANHPLLKLFDNNESASHEPSYDADGYGSSLQASIASSGASSTDTIRPSSIAIPDFDDNDDISAFAPTATPWYLASETSVANIPREDEVAEDSGEGENGLEADLTDDSADNAGFISIPSGSISPSTARPSWEDSITPTSNIFNPNPFNVNAFNPNPFPKQRNRQASNDSAYGPFGGASFSSDGSGSLDKLPLSPSSSLGSDRLPRAESPESFIARRSSVTNSPSLPTLPRLNSDADNSLDTSHHVGSVPLASRIRSNTAPNFDSASSPIPPIPSDIQEKNVLNFQKSNPFAAARAAMQRRPSALNIPVPNGAMTPGALTPRHITQVCSLIPFR